MMSPDQPACQRATKRMNHVEVVDVVHVHSLARSLGATPLALALSMARHQVILIVALMLTLVGCSYAGSRELRELSELMRSMPTLRESPICRDPDCGKYDHHHASYHASISIPTHWAVS